jgi:hypothetical protein
MSISNVSGTSASYSVTSASDSTRTRTDPMANVAKLLNMSSDDLRSALKNGSSLSDIAAKQGVSRDDLLKTIQSDLKNRPQRGPGGPGGSGDGSGTDSGSGTDTGTGTSAVSDTDFAAMAAKIADTKGLPSVSGHHRHHGSGSTSNSSSLIGSTTDAATLAAQLQQGSSIDVLL